MFSVVISVAIVKNVYHMLCLKKDLCQFYYMLFKLSIKRFTATAKESFMIYKQNLKIGQKKCSWMKFHKMYIYNSSYLSKNVEKM